MYIVCTHVPRFAVEVERQRRKDSATRLILIGDARVFDCSLGAQASGVRRGMRMSEAVGLCHRADVLPPDLRYYQRRFEEVLDFLEGLSPAMEAGDPSTGSGQALGTAYLSLDGVSVDPQPLAEELITSLHHRFGFMSCVAFANSKFVTRVAALITRAGLVKVVPTGHDAAFLAPLPLDHLPASHSMRWRLGLLGLETIGDIARLPLGEREQTLSCPLRTAYTDSESC